MLEKNLEYQRRTENEAKQKCLNDESIRENASECVRQTQDKKKNKKKKNKNNRKAKESKETKGGKQYQPCQDNASPDTELGDSVNVDEMTKLITKEHLEHESQIENGDKKKCLEEKIDDTGESVVEYDIEGVSVIYSKHIKDDEYEKRFQTDIEKAVCQSLGSLKKHYGLLLPTDAKVETTTSRLDDVHLYVIIQSQWRLRLFRDELMSRSEKKHTHAGDPCFVCAYSDTYAAIRIATKELPGKVVAPFSSKTLRPVYDFFKEWVEMGVSTSDNELKRRLVTVVQHESSISRQKRATVLLKGSKDDFLSLLRDSNDAKYPIYMTGPMLYTLCTAVIDLDEQTLNDNRRESQKRTSFSCLLCVFRRFHGTMTKALKSSVSGELCRLIEA
ncbi:hypothetical protein QYF36_012131 [Acer negundo]|nr:hypothetical protein QYF36_012131 [Acer negundo]